MSGRRFGPAIKTFPTCSCYARLLRTTCPLHSDIRSLCSSPVRSCISSSTVQRYSAAWRDGELWLRINHHLLMGRPARPRGARPAHRPVSSTASRSRPRKAVVHGALTRARRSRAANATSSPTPQACWLPLRSTAPTSRIATAPLGARVHPPRLPLAASRLRRRCLCRPQACGGSGADWSVDLGDCPAHGWCARFRYPTAPLGGRAHAGLVEPQSDGSSRTSRPASPPARAWLFIASVQLLTRRPVRY